MIVPLRWWLRLGLAGLVSALTDLSGLALLATSVWLITRAAQQPPLIALSVAIVGVRAFAIGKGTLRYVERLVSHDVVLRLLAVLRTRVFAGLASTSTPIPRGDALTRLVSDVDGVQDALLRCALPVGVGIVVTAATFAFTAAFSIPAALLILAGMLLAGALVPALAYTLTRRAARRLAPARAAQAAASLDVVYGAADLAAFGALPEALGRAAERAGALARLERSVGRGSSALGAAGALLPGLTALAVLATVTSAGRAAGGGLAREMVAVLPLLALAAVEVLLPLQSAAVRYAELRGSLARVRPLLRPVTGLDAGDGAADVLAGPAGVALRDVTVRYPGGAGPALSGVDLAIPPGRRVAVVGPSGSGKSTLLGVIAGAVPVAAGTVSLGGTDAAGAAVAGAAVAGAGVAAAGGPAVAGADAGERWRVAGGLLADAHVFHTTVRENLTLGRPGLDDAALRDALTTAGVGPDELPLDRVVGTDGAALSGGERTRLLVARGLLDTPPILLLDEPTEGLDPTAADALVGRVLDAAGERGVVLVTHRLVDLSAFDEVVVLDAGRVVQRGTHAQLTSRPGWYARWQGSARLAEPGYTAVAGTTPGYDTLVG